MMFLALTNIADSPIHLEQIICERDTSVGYRNLTGPTETATIRPPPCALASKETAIVPIGLLMSPIKESGELQVGISRVANRGDYANVLFLTNFSSQAILSDFRLLGPRLTPKQVHVQANGVMLTQPVHELDLTNVYTLDKVWQCGSCPHVFAVTVDGNIRYVGEALAKGECRRVTQGIRIPSDVREIIIVELEDELCHISRIELDGRMAAANIHLKKGDEIRLDVQGASMLALDGAYFSTAVVIETRHAVTIRNRLVCNYMAAWFHSRADATQS